MSNQKTTVDDFVEKIPSAQEVRRRLSQNLQEARLLRQLLRIALQREKAAEACHD